jgi:phosphoglycolate phosphatase
LRFDLVLFDLDGTLVDSLPDIASALNHALGAAGLAPLSMEVVRGLVGEGVLRLVEKALDVQSAAGVDANALARQVVDIYAQHPCVETRLYPGIAELLAGCRQRGVRLAVLTNKMGAVARSLLAELRIADLFDAVVGDGDGHARKPSPDAAQALFRRFGVAPERALMVGDGLPDLAVARAAGCPAAAVAWGYTDRAALVAQRPAYLVDAPGDVLALIG